eukprot:Em0011g56a
MTLFARAAWRLDAVCGVRALLATCAGARGVHTKHADLAGAKDNPYLEKYKARIEEVQGPVEEKKRSQGRKKASVTTQLPAPQPPRPLDPTVPHLSSVMHLNLIEDKTPEEISKIWTEYHKTKDGVCAVIPASTYTQLHVKAALCPHFLYALPREEGYEFFYSQFAGHRIYFTSLIQYKLHNENAPVCLTLTHYTELQDSKGLVLMAGEIGSSGISLMDALCLANQVQLYYSTADPERYTLLRQFNHEPQNFEYTKLVEMLHKTAAQV